uniref:Uncharacterized protein n=1 Tax=Salix viminalis TaxID=40686 RepID=A0A6N2M4P5_SALVM
MYGRRLSHLVIVRHFQPGSLSIGLIHRNYRSGLGRHHSQMKLPRVKMGPSTSSTGAVSVRWSMDLQRKLERNAESVRKEMFTKCQDPAILGKFDVQTGLGVRKKESKVGGSEANCIGNGMERTNPSGLNIPQAHEEKQSADHAQVRNVSKNWHIPSSFPSEAVISAYSYPYVDKSIEPFTWGKPDLHSLHRLCWEKFGWHIQKSDELLLLVLKEYNKYEKIRFSWRISCNSVFASMYK